MTAKTGLLQRSPFFWAALMFVAYGAVAALQLTGAVEGAASILLYFLPIGLVLPLYRSALALHVRSGTHTAAISTYNKRFMLATFAYLVGLGIAVSMDRAFALGTITSFAIAMLPALPVLGMIWAMARYLQEEQDEYLRHRAVMAALFGLALLLGLASFWGFLETFGIAPHVPGWSAVPIWAVGMGLSQCWMSLRSLPDGEES